MNSFGRNFRVAIFGESHGEAVGVVVDGVKPGIELSVRDFEADLARRRGGGAAGKTPRREADEPQIVSGVFEGRTTGAPVAILFRNENVRSGDYERLANHPRPSHADWVGRCKSVGYGDPRGGGHFSGRLTLGLVAAGGVAKKKLASPGGGVAWGVGAGVSGGGLGGGALGGVRISSEIVELGGVKERAEFERVVADAVRDGDSVGGVIECRADGVPEGLGEPFFDSVESVVSHIMFSIPGVKGVEFGSGFAGAALRGSENNDPIVDERGRTEKNNAGGVNGGISNGNQIVMRAAVKPTASIAKAQQTWNFATGRAETLEIGGRHDACIALRAAVVVEAAMAVALCDLSLQLR